MLYTKTSLAFGTNTTVAIFSPANPAGRMMPVVASAPAVLRRLITAGVRGLPAASLRGRDADALADLKKMGVRLDRSRHAGRGALVGTVEVVDQRMKEAA